MCREFWKLKQVRIDKGPHHRTFITNNKITAAPQFDVFTDCQDLLYYWKLIKILSELVSTGLLQFGVSLKHFIVFAYKPWLQLLRTK